MKLLISGDGGLLDTRLRQALGDGHDVGGLPFTELRDRDQVQRAVEDRETVIQLVPTGYQQESDLDLLDSATRGTYNLLTTMTGGRLILVTSLRPFARYAANWRVTEQWAPRPTTDVTDLAPYLAELTAREVCRVRPVEVIVLRVGEGVADAVQAVEQALIDQPELEAAASRWRVFHVPGGELAEAASLQTAGLAAVPSPVRSPRKVVIYGAGGPLGAATAAHLASDHVLRLTDIRPLAEIAAGKPQSRGAPLPRALGSPHEERRVDVSDPAQVMAAAEGMDAIVNCSVVRPDPVNAFRVNTLGAYNVARAAITHGIQRIVHTGPVQFLLDHPSGYTADFDVSAEIPPRPGDNLYFISKYLGQEICRIFAQEHGLSIPALLFGNFVNPAEPPDASKELYPFTVSWRDAAVAMHRALHVEALPRPFEVLHINADLPHGQYPNDKAKRLLGWEPQDELAELYQR
ncbi:MAG: NAD-dependent epimerase/dehydratase family protein [Thermomicrobiales bacterium]